MNTSSKAQRYGEWVIAKRVWLLLLSLAAVLLMASGGRLLEFSTSYRVFFSEYNPQLLAFDALENTYTKNDNVLFVVAPRDGQVFTRATLAALEELTEAAWQIPYSIRVDSLTNFQHTYAEGDDLVVGDLVREANSLSTQELNDIRAIALREPLLAQRLISPQAHVTGVNVTVQLPGINETTEVPEVVAFVRELVQTIQQHHPNLDIHLTGMVMLNNAFSESSMKDMSTLVPVSFAVIMLSLLLLLRGWTGTFSTFWLIMFSIASGMGLAGWLGMRITPPSASAPTIILTLAVANAVHVLVGFRHAMGKGLAKEAAMVESLRINLQPIFLTNLTTALGFLSMNASDVPPFRDLGNIVTMGVAAAFMFSVTFLPALTVMLPVRAPRTGSTTPTAMQRLGDFVVARRRPLLWVMAALIVVLVAFVPRNELNDVFVHYFAPSTSFRAATDFSEQNLTGLYRVEYSLASGEPGGISEPAFLAQASGFVDWLRGQPEVMHVNAVTDTMKRLNMNMHGDAPGAYQLPDQRELAAQYLLLYEMSLPYGLDLNDQINVDKSATRVSVTTQTLSVKEFLTLDERAQAWLREHAPNIQGADGTGPTMMFSHIGKRNILSMLLGTTVALIMISLVLVVALRSIKIGLVSLVPNLVPAAMGFGVWGLTVGEVGLGLSVVMGMTLGIIVDDTVHFLSKYLRARREHGYDAPDAVRYAFASVGTALWVTSAVLIAGFTVLALSTFRMNSDMGLLTAITIGLALVADFLFLPPLLMKIEEKSNAHKDVTNSTTRAELAAD